MQEGDGVSSEHEITVNAWVGTESPEMFSVLPNLRWAVDSRSDAHPVLQQAWRGSRGTLCWETVPTVVVE